MNEPKSTPPNPLHPQAKALGKNKLNNPPKKEIGGAAVTAKPAATPKTPAIAAVSTPKSEAPSAPGKDLKRFEITVSINGSSEPPFVVDVALTGNGANDQAAARALAKKRHPGAAMTVISSRIFTRTENCLLEIAPGSTLSALFGAPGEVTGDLIEIGKAFHDGSRGAIFLRNMRSHIGITFRPSSGGLIVYSNRVASNRLASELPMIVAEILGNGAREIEIYLKP